LRYSPLFSILHTSSRPEKWRAVYDAWMSKAAQPANVEYVLCVDRRWGFTAQHVRDAQEDGCNVVENETPYQYSGYVSGVNLAAKASSGSILIVVADDQFPCEGWDEELLNLLRIGQEITSFTNPIANGIAAGTEFVVEVSTGTVNEHERGIMVMPILSRARYERLGYVFYPAYESMYADNDFCEHARQDGCVIDGRSLPVFPHEHPLIPVEGVPGRKVPGWMQETELLWLYETAKGMNSVVEIGSFKGRSTVALASGCKGPVYAVDHFSGPTLAGTDPKAIRKEFERNTLSFPNVHLICEHSIDAARRFLPHEPEMVFIDGYHAYEQVKADLLAWLPKAKKLICGHDYGHPNWPGVKQAVDEILGPGVQVSETIWSYRIDQDVKLPEAGVKGWDKSYQAQHNQGAYELGEFALAKRRANGFTDLECSVCGAHWGTEHKPECDRKGTVKILPAANNGKPTIAWCLPMEGCSAGWFVSSINLYHHMQVRGFNVLTVSAQSSACHVSREVIRRAVLEMEPAADYLLWQDSDNPMTPDQFDLLLRDLETYPDLMSVSGWYRMLPDPNGHIATSAAQMNDRGECQMVDEADIVTAPGLIETAWHGMGGVLMRRAILDMAGDKPFALMPAPNSAWGCTGEDTAFFLRATAGGAKITIDPRVYLPHLKLGEIGERPKLFPAGLPAHEGIASPLIRGGSSLSVQTMNRRRKVNGNSHISDTDNGTSTNVNGTDGPFCDSSNSPYISSLQTRVNDIGRSHLLAACLRVKNEGRWIYRVLRALDGIADVALILENGSDDITRDEIQRASDDCASLKVYSYARRSERSDEGQDRQDLLGFARAYGAQWYLNVDGDEELTEGEPGELRRLLSSALTRSVVPTFCLQKMYLWNASESLRPETLRVDRWYSAAIFPQIFRVTDSLQFRSIKNGIHTQTSGTRGQNLFLPTVKLWHYGYMLRQDRIAKWKFYNSIDPNNQAEDRYRHTVQGDVPEVPADARLAMAGPLRLIPANGMTALTRSVPQWTEEEIERLRAYSGECKIVETTART
jgi:hypothetical protein